MNESRSVSKVISLCLFDKQGCDICYVWIVLSRICIVLFSNGTDCHVEEVTVWR